MTTLVTIINMSLVYLTHLASAVREIAQVQRDSV